MSREIICENKRQDRLLSMLFRKSGVQRRRTVVPYRIAYQWKQESDVGGRGPSTGQRMSLYQQFAPSLAGEACRSAFGMDALMEEIESKQTVLSKRVLQPRDVTHLVTVSCTGFSAPGLDWFLQESLGLPTTVQRVQVGFMGCQGLINGFRVARGLVAADPDAVVLICAVELCSLHYRLDWQDEAMIGNALFADGAAAALLAGPEHMALPAGPQHIDSTCDRALSVIDSASIRIPLSGDQMSWRIGDYGFDMELTGQVPVSIQGHLREWLAGWLGRHHVSFDDIVGWYVHPGGPRILDATEASLGLCPSKLAASRRVLASRGNMSSPTVAFVLQEEIAAKERVPQGPQLMLAFGPGLVAEATLLS